MFTLEDLALPAGELVTRLRSATSGMVEDRRAPEELRDVAFLFQLDDEVRNGGFAQYFFNHGCLNAFDAWFASETMDDVAHDILSLALLRLGVEFGVNLDLRALVSSGGGKALGPAYEGLLGIYEQTHEAAGELIPRFAAFRERLAAPRETISGFDDLNARFFEETALPSSIVEYVASNPDAFVR